MTTLFFLIRNFFKLNFYKKSRIFTLFLLPCITMAVLVLLFGQSGESEMEVRVGVINNDKGAIGAELIHRLIELPGHKVIELSSEAQVKELLIAEKQDLIITLPASLTIDLLAAGQPVVEMVIIKEHSSIWVDLEVQSYLEICAALSAEEGQTEAGLLSALTDLQRGGYHISMQVDAPRSQLVERIIGVLLLFLFAQAMSVTRLILKDKEERTYYRIRTTPVSEITYIMGNLIAAVLLLSLQIAMTLTVAIGIMKIDLGVSVVQLYFLLMLYCFTGLGIGLLVIGIARSQEQASNISILILIPACMLGGCYWSAGLMPGFMQKIAWITPQYWTMTAFEAMGTDFSAAGVNLLIITAMGVFFIALYWLIMKNTHTVESFR